MNIAKHIPNAITCGNILCGAAGIVFAFDGSLELSFCMMLAAAVFDFADGFAARLLNARSEIGKELDSLCDVVSFGVLPSVMLVRIMQSSAYTESGDFPAVVFSMIPLLIAVFSALRLAKFNLDERQHESFLGLPTPAAAIFCGAVAAYASADPGSALASWCSSGIFIPLLTFCICALLVCEVPMFSMKFATGSKTPSREKTKRILFVLVVLVSLVCTIVFRLRWTIIPLISFAGYIIGNLVFALIPQKS